MRLGKGFVLFVLLTVMVSAGVANAQTTDEIWFNPMDITIDPAPASDTTWSWAVMAKWDSTLGAIAIPLFYPGIPELDLDTLVTTPPDIKGITYGPAGGSPTPWTLRTSLPNLTANSLLAGFITFAAAPPSAADTLLYLHWKLLGGAANNSTLVDTGLVGTSRLTMTTTGAVDYTPNWVRGSVTVGPTAVGDNGALPLEYGLDQNFPNPFNAQTMINFSMHAQEHVVLKVYNVLGQEVVTLLDQQMDAAKHEILWEGNNNQGTVVASGTYFYSLKIGDSFEETRQMTLLK